MQRITDKELNTIMKTIARKYNLVYNSYRNYWEFNPNIIKWLKKPYIFNFQFTYKTIYLNDDKLTIFNRNLEISDIKDLEEVKELIESYIKIMMLDRFFFIKTSDYIEQHSNSIIGKGKFICYKKVMYNCKYYIAKLEVPAKAKCCQLVYESKFRVSEAKVLGFYTVGKNGKLRRSKIKQAYPVQYRMSPDFRYYIGKVAYPDSWDSSPISCSHGIHAFMNVEEAISY